jgi:hypothetical protein
VTPFEPTASDHGIVSVLDGTTRAPSLAHEHLLLVYDDAYVAGASSFGVNTPQFQLSYGSATYSACVAWDATAADLKLALQTYTATLGAGFDYAASAVVQKFTAPVNALAASLPGTRSPNGNSYLIQYPGFVGAVPLLLARSCTADPFTGTQKLAVEVPVAGLQSPQTCSGVCQDGVVLRSGITDFYVTGDVCLGAMPVLAWNALEADVKNYIENCAVTTGAFRKVRYCYSHHQSLIVCLLHHRNDLSTMRIRHSTLNDHTVLICR